MVAKLDAAWQSSVGGSPSTAYTNVPPRRGSCAAAGSSVIAAVPSVAIVIAKPSLPARVLIMPAFSRSLRATLR